MAKNAEARLVEIEALCESVPWGADETELLSVLNRIADIARGEGDRG